MNRMDWKDLAKETGKFYDYELPKVSIVIPIKDSRYVLGATLDSIFSQDYPDFEVILIDAGAIDQTFDFLQAYPEDKVRHYAVSSYHIVEMLNKGSSLATGLYINFLFPGDYFIGNHCFKVMMSKALTEHTPDLIFCGAQIREKHSDPRTFYRPYSKRELRAGHQPTTIQSCFFLLESFRIHGKFNPAYEVRGAFDFLSSFYLDKNYRWVAVSRIYTDNDRREITLGSLYAHFQETVRILFHRFGLGATCVWLFRQTHTRKMANLFLRKVRLAFFGAGK